mmetsp:Transcript_24662/g.93234  ORF Transcript_24662/g.93234 Transcript_24662/m.93234 type:complete len:210 (-) Transcript_24662:505-1134(-)
MGCRGTGQGQLRAASAPAGSPARGQGVPDHAGHGEAGDVRRGGPGNREGAARYPEAAAYGRGQVARGHAAGADRDARAGRVRVPAVGRPEHQHRPVEGPSPAGGAAPHVDQELGGPNARPRPLRGPGRQPDPLPGGGGGQVPRRQPQILPRLGGPPGQAAARPLRLRPPFAGVPRAVLRLQQALPPGLHRARCLPGARQPGARRHAHVG